MSEKAFDPEEVGSVVFSPCGDLYETSDIEHTLRGKSLECVLIEDFETLNRLYLTTKKAFELSISDRLVDQRWDSPCAERDYWMRMSLNNSETSGTICI